MKYSPRFFVATFVLILGTSLVPITAWSEAGKPTADVSPIPSSSPVSQSAEDRLNEIHSQAKNRPEVLQREEDQKAADKNLKSASATARATLDPEDKAGILKSQLKAGNTKEEIEAAKAAFKEIERKIAADPGVVGAKKALAEAKGAYQNALIAAATAIDPAYPQLAKEAKDQKKKAKSSKD